jgi:hypothetical protein
MKRSTHLSTGRRSFLKGAAAASAAALTGTDAAPAQARQPGNAVRSASAPVAPVEAIRLHLSRCLRPIVLAPISWSTSSRHLASNT